MSQAGKLSSSDALRGLRPDQVNRDPGDENDAERAWMTAPYGERVSDSDGAFDPASRPEDDEDQVDVELEVRGL